MRTVVYHINIYLLCFRYREQPSERIRIMNIIGKFNRIIGNRLLINVTLRETRLLKIGTQATTVVSFQKQKPGQFARGMFTCQSVTNIGNINCDSPINRTTTVSSFLTPATSNLQFLRSYKAKAVLTLRCSGCYFKRRQGRLFVECTLKPRHKQMQIVSKSELFKDDTSKGDVNRACWWKCQKQRWYKMGNTEYKKVDWLQDRLGKEV